MTCIKSAPRAALTALAPEAPYLAAGTMSGAVDMSFSASANIEIFSLDFQSDSPDLPLLACAPAPDRFNRLAWSRPGAVEGESFSLGLLAGGLSDGSVAVWNPLSMISSQGQAEDAMVARLEKHTGPVSGLEFSELTPNRLASGADEGDLFIWDLKNPSEPTVFPPLKSVSSSAQAGISSLSWNPKFQHIVASTSSNGMTVVWDLRNQKPLTSFSDSTRRPCSVLQWNPDMSTQLIVASDDDNSPSLRVWDVRKTISPVREFVGHSKGVIAMSWCPYDSSFLLTCSKDNRTICWDTVSGEIISELPTSTNGNFDVHWYRKIPGVIAAASFDGKIGVHNLEFSGLYAAGDAIGAPARTRAPAPKWLKCPTGASFGFGGKLVSFHPAAPAQGVQVATSEVHVHNLVIEQSLVSRSTEFEAAMQNGDKSSLRALCEKKSQESISDDERETWGFLRVMFEDGDVARTKLLAHLGFEPPQAPTVDSTDELSKTLEDTLNLDHGTVTDYVDAQFLVDNGDDFFNNPQPSEPSVPEESVSTNDEQKEQEIPADVVPSDPSIDTSIQHALVVGDYKGAVNQCLAANRMADALVIAHAGGTALWESTRNHYLKNSISPYLKVVSALVGNDLASFVSTWPLSEWKETLALLCTFAQKEEWTVLCDTLASRLLNVGDTLAATLCYICAGNIDKTVEIWSRNLKSEDGGKTYVDLLQDLMEKTITLALATSHKRFSASLSKLVENYAKLLASQGLRKTAMEYLKLLESDEHSHELAILRDQIACSTEENAAAGSSATDPNASYAANHYMAPDPSQNLYQALQPYSVPTNTYSEVYQQQSDAYNAYQPNAYQPPQPAHIFVPPSTPATSQRHLRHLPTGYRAGVLIGDGASVGKGLTIASLIRENWQQGRHKAVWVTDSYELVCNDRRDLEDVGARYVPVRSLHRLPTTHAIEITDGVIFVTYSNLSIPKGRPRVDQVIKWCGPEFDGLLVFDECHKAKNLIPDAGSEPTRTFKAVLKIQEKLPEARVVYYSATGASEPRNLSFMVRLGLWGDGTSFENFPQFLGALEKGGVGTFQELVAMDMKASGHCVHVEERRPNFGFPRGGKHEAREIEALAENHEEYWASEDHAHEAYKKALHEVNLADTSATKEARIQEAEAKLNHCEATCNRITELERELSESSSSLRRSKERISELEQRVSKMEKELCSTKDAAAANEQRLGAELSTVMKLAELHKESSEEWSKKAGELEGVIKALETHLTQVEDEYKEKLEKETLSRIDLEKEADNLKQKLEKCELDLENTRKSSELSLVPFSSVAPNSADLRDSAMPISDAMNQNDLMIIPKVPSGVSGTALAASLLRDGWSLAKIYEKYPEATDALHHEWQGRRHAEAVLERVLHEIEEKAELILDERAEHERMVEAYALMDQKLQQALLEHDNFESTIRSLKSELNRRERDHSVAQKEIDDLQKEIAVLLKECQDIQLRCGSSLPNVGPGPLSASLANDLSNAENNLKDSMSFKDINELVQQNVQLRNQVHILSADLDKKDMELRESFQIELKKIVDDAASRVEKVMKKSEEQAIMIESLHRSVAMYRKLDKKNAFDSCMKQVEDMRKELQNSCKAVSDAESRAAAAEARCSVLEAKLKSRKSEVGKKAMEDEISKLRDNLSALHHEISILCQTTDAPLCNKYLI